MSKCPTKTVQLQNGKSGAVRSMHRLQLKHRCLTRLTAGSGKSLANEIDILRAQKKLLNFSTDVVDQKSDVEEPQSLIPAICALIFVRRVMKMSHVIHRSSLSSHNSACKGGTRFSDNRNHRQHSHPLLNLHKRHR